MAAEVLNIVVFKFLTVGHDLRFDVAPKVVRVCKNGRIRSARDGFHLRFVIIRINQYMAFRVSYAREASRAIVVITNAATGRCFNALHTMYRIMPEMKPFTGG